MRRLFVILAAATFAATVLGPRLSVAPAFADRLGDYDEHHHWHDADWWHQRNPDWVWQHHPEWARGHREWRNDGDWDDQHRWHNRQWWLTHDRSWVGRHHPDWR